MTAKTLKALLPVLVISLGLSRTAHADVGSNAITFINTSTQQIVVEFEGKYQCMNNVPPQGSSVLKKNDRKSFTLSPDSACGDSSITFIIRQGTGNKQYPMLAGPVTYRKYKGKGGKWLTKVEFVPNNVKANAFLHALCGKPSIFCKNQAVVFTEPQAAIGVINVGLVVDNPLWLRNPKHGKGGN